MAISFGLLGPVDGSVGGCALRLGGRQQKAVLAMLLLQAGSTVGQDWLIWGLWGDDPPPAATSTLRTYLSRLRSVLAHERIQLHHVGGGYRLGADRATLDVFQFEQLLESGSAALAAGDCDQAQHLLRDALGLWRGAPLEDVADFPFAVTEVARLGELRLRTRELRIDADLELGRHQAVIAELTALVERHPLRESLTATLATALYRADRQADALHVLRTTRQQLADELGVDPGPRLRSMEVAVLRHEMDPPRPSAAIGRPVRLSPRPTGLAGREELLAALHARLVESDEPSPRVVALCGLGGVGKSSIAVEFAHRFGNEYGLVWQLAVEDPATLSAQVAELARVLRAAEPSDHADPVGRVHAALAARIEPWLLVLDNALDPESVRAVMPPAGHGHVLITSQYPHWPPGQGLDVPVLAPGAAAAYLLSRAKDTDTAGAAALADELGMLPLALEQAGAFMEATGRRTGEYLQLFREHRTGLLDRGDPSGYDKRVATTWTLAFQQLQHRAPAAVTLLRLASCYAPEAIPVRLLLTRGEELPSSVDQEIAEQIRTLRAEDFGVDDAITALRRYSLIGPPADGTVSVHRLVQAVTADQLPTGSHDAWRHAAARLVTAALPADPQQPGNWPVYAALLPHARAVLDESTDSLADVARYLGAIGDYTTACALGERVLRAREAALSPEHPGALAIRQDLAYWTGQAGHGPDARDQFAVLLPIQERVLGTEHPATLTTRHGYACWIGVAGDWIAARDQLAALLPIRARVLGAEHPDTLSTRHILGRSTGLAGDASGARDQFAALVPIREHVLGAEHPDTLLTQRNLGDWTGESGAAGAARDQLAALLPISERILGAEHPDSLVVRHNLAQWTGKSGDPAAARDQFAALLPIHERVLGTEHPATLSTRRHLAWWTGVAGEPAAAHDEFAKLLPIHEQLLGAEHSDTLATRHGLARWIEAADHVAAARGHVDAQVPIHERLLGAEHPDTPTASIS